MKQKRSLFLVLAALALLAATWSTLLLINNQRQQTLDQRVLNVAAQLKCLVCQGESVAASPSQLAQQMRVIIREQLQGGKSEQEVITYFVHNYGEQIAWSPRWQGFSLLAWLVPIAFVLGGILLMLFVLREWRAAPPTPAIHGGGRASSPDDTVSDPTLERYRAQLEAELAGDDPLFRRYKPEAR